MALTQLHIHLGDAEEGENMKSHSEETYSISPPKLRGSITSVSCAFPVRAPATESLAS